MSIHGFQRFLDNHEYRTAVPVQSLFFEVTVKRAPLTDEAATVLIAQEVVGWGTKLPSLAETLFDYQQMAARREDMARGIVAAGGEPSQLSDASLEEEDPSGMAAYRLVSRTEGSTAQERMANVCRSGPSILFTRPPAEEFIPPHDAMNVVDPPQPPTPLTIAMLRDHRNRNAPNTRMHFGIALGTIMPLPPGLRGTAAAMHGVRGAVQHPDALREHNEAKSKAESEAEKQRRKAEKAEQKQKEKDEKKAKKEEEKRKKKEKEGKKKEGDTAADDDSDDDDKEEGGRDILGARSRSSVTNADGGEDMSSPNPRRAENARRPPATDEVEMLHTDGDGNITTFAGGADNSTLSDYCFVGQEIIMASVDNVGENAMHCKPSLADEHTCFVDSEYIYTFTITITDRDPTVRPASPPRAASVAGPTMGGTVRSAMMVRMFANMMKSTVRASRRFAEATGVGASIAVGNNYIQSNAKEERDRQTLLKQAILNRMRQQKVAGAASLAAAAKANNIGGPTGGANNANKRPGDAPTFAPPPEQKSMMRIHVMGTIESTFNIDQDSLFVRFRFLLPDGCVEDSAANIRGGLPPSLAGPTTSQLAWASRIRDEDFVFRTMHTFNQPLELHATLPVNSPTPIRLIMSFYSKGSGGDYFQTAEGYGQQTIPMFAGTYNFEVLLWRPKPTAYEYLKSVFIGGTPRLADDEDVAIPAHVMDGCASRSGLQTESTGWARLKINILSHSRPDGADDRFAAKAKTR